ncbi:MAG: nicotinamide-nucleotide amidohydrolase family protein [Coriobacteriia bacterium]
MARKTAAIVTIGSELAEGLRVDTNSAEIARELGLHDFRVLEAVSVGDDRDVLASVLRDLVGKRDLVVTTGGLGPTHDDVTREAAAQALGIGMSPNPEIAKRLQSALLYHHEPEARAQLMNQALVLDGAEVLGVSGGTAAGQVIPTPKGLLVLLPGPPGEMCPMLRDFLERFPSARAVPRELGVAGLPESDVQMPAQRALKAYPGVGFTVLAKAGDVRVILLDEGAGPEALDAAAEAVKAEIGAACYAGDGSTLPETLVHLAAERGLTLAVAESCTGGLVAGAITGVPGASSVFLGGVVSYSNEAKMALLGVGASTLADYGAVSAETAAEMAAGTRERFGADLAVSTTGIAGPGGGTPEKPIGLVWFGIADGRGVRTVRRQWPERFGRQTIRVMATAFALDLLRHEVLGE